MHFTGLLAASLAIVAASSMELFDREVGTASYNCHDNCGQAMLEVENGDVCDDSIFLTDYAACLSCSGSDNLDIWKYYGPQLTSAAAACGLETTPAAGVQSTTVQSAIAAETGASETSAVTSAAGASTSSAAASGTTSATAETTTSGTAVATSTGNTTSTASTSIATAGGWTQFAVNMPLLSLVLAISAVRAMTTF
ncbi:hypothetical protein BJ166DRAFT_620856 [Pestalotiopsis sp. NC0098]|nr:hypothetical protein BJ166DRAFT_620856 [Pestalotiopsis sp. NC0098]